MYDSNEKMEISVLSIPGVNETLVDNFFINGRTREWLDSSIINIVMENPVSDGIFAVTSHMDFDGKNGGPSISFVKELKRFQSKYNKSGGELESKTTLLREQISDVNNFIHSIALAKNDAIKASENLEAAESDGSAEADVNSDANEISSSVEGERSVACVYIEDGKYTLLSSGNAKVFIHSNGISKQITNAKLRIERLVKLGVMTEEQARGISDSESDGISQFPKATLSSGDSLVLCTGGATQFIDEQKLSVILSNPTNLTTKSSDILKGGAEFGLDDDLTIMLINVGKSEKYEDAFLDDFEEEENNFSGKLALIFAVILALVVGLAAGYMMLPGVFGKRLVDSDAKISIGEKSTSKPTQAPNSQLIEPTSEPAVEQTEPPIATIEPTAEPTPSLSVDANGNKIYVVQKGDSFGGIAEKIYGKFSKYQLIMDANKITSVGSLKVGQKLIIP